MTSMPARLSTFSIRSSSTVATSVSSSPAGEAGWGLFVVMSVVAALADSSVATLSTLMVTTRPRQANSAQPFRVKWWKRRARCSLNRWLYFMLFYLVFMKKRLQR